MSNKLGQEPAFPNESNAYMQMPDCFGMSKRFYAAIKLRVPDSGEEWLDEMIRKSNRRDAAQYAMQGLLSNGTENIYEKDLTVLRSFQYADELLKQESNEQK